MKKKILMIISALVFGITGMFANGIELSAQETSNVEKDYSYLLTGDAIIGRWSKTLREPTYQVEPLLSKMLGQGK